MIFLAKCDSVSVVYLISIHFLIQNFAFHFTEHSIWGGIPPAVWAISQIFVCNFNLFGIFVCSCICLFCCRCRCYCSVSVAHNTKISTDTSVSHDSRRSYHEVISCHGQEYFWNAHQHIDNDRLKAKVLFIARCAFNFYFSIFIQRGYWNDMIFGLVVDATQWHACETWTNYQILLFSHFSQFTYLHRIGFYWWLKILSALVMPVHDEFARNHFFQLFDMVEKKQYQMTLRKEKQKHW